MATTIPGTSMDASHEQRHQRDRQLMLEDALARKGIDVTELIERHPPQRNAAKAIEADRKRFVGEVLAALQPAGDRLQK